MPQSRSKPLFSAAAMIVLFVLVIVAVVVLAVFGATILADDFFAQFEE